MNISISCDKIFLGYMCFTKKQQHKNHINIRFLPANENDKYVFYIAMVFVFCVFCWVGVASCAMCLKEWNFAIYICINIIVMFTCLPVSKSMYICKMSALLNQQKIEVYLLLESGCHPCFDIWLPKQWIMKQNWWVSNCIVYVNWITCICFIKFMYCT